MSPTVREIHAWLPFGTVFKHCCYLHRFGYIILHEPVAANPETEVNVKVKTKTKPVDAPCHHVELTRDGMAWYLTMKSAYTQSVIAYLGSILMLVLGVVIGRVL